jgi:putative oxidoreductase
MVTLNHAHWSPRMLSILRIMTGLLFMEHGTQKLLGFPPAANPGPALFSLLGVQGILELAGGLLIVLGLFTRPVAFILAGDMAVAYFMSHAPRAFFPISTEVISRSFTASYFFTLPLRVRVFGASIIFGVAERRSRVT